jgi:hypothetical protein
MYELGQLRDPQTIRLIPSKKQRNIYVFPLLKAFLVTFVLLGLAMLSLIYVNK